jgi:hypothetical protein
LKPALSVVPGAFSVHRLAPDAPLPEKLAHASPCWIARTADELSIVCAEDVDLDSPRCQAGWACLRVVGPLDFELTGILAGIASVLAEGGISLFALSTFDTDYVLVKAGTLPQAVAALREAGYPIG